MTNTDPETPARPSPASTLLCVVDTATTGLPSAPDAQVTEIAAPVFDLEAFEEIRCWSTLVRPTVWSDEGRRITQEICGLSPDLIEAFGEDPKTARMRLYDFADGLPLHAWNSPFDEEMVRRMDPSDPMQAALAKRWGPCLMREFSAVSRGDANLRSKLTFAYEQCGFGEPEGAHRALVDARMAARVIAHLRSGGALGRARGPTHYDQPTPAPRPGGVRKWTPGGLVAHTPNPQE